MSKKLTNATKDKIIKWFGYGRTGESSEAIALAITGSDVKKNYPRDPSDFNRCLLFLEAVPDARDHMYKVAHLSPIWKKFINCWDIIEDTFIQEAGLDWCKGNTAPKTYKLIQAIVD